MLYLNRVPDLTTLEIFRVVTQTGSISKAARELGMSQQAVSARMRALEATTRLTLLQRSPTGVQLTPHGLGLQDHADRILEAAALFQKHVTATSGERGASLNIAASQTLAEHLVPRWLMAFRRELAATEASPTEVAVTVGNTQDVIKFLRSQVVELGFVESPNLPPDLSHRVIATDQLVLVVTPSHRWATLSSPVPVSDLARTALVMREEGSGTRDALDAALARHGTAPCAPALELGTTSAVRSAVVAGIAPSFLSLRTVASDLEARRLVQVPTALGQVTRPFNAIWHGPVHRLSAGARQFLALANGAKS